MSRFRLFTSTACLTAAVLIAAIAVTVQPPSRELPASVNLTTVIVEQPDDAQLHELVLLCRTEGDGQEDVSVLVKERLNVEPSHRIADCVDEP